jgi:hypothetical protein
MPEIEILRVGKFTSTNGIEVDLSADVLGQIVETYNPQNFKAPLIISHDTRGAADADLAESELAYGWPSALKMVGDRVKAVFEKVSPKFTEWVRGGRLLGVSASLYTPDSSANPNPGKWSLRHIAGLGKSPPAIKGLEPLSLSDWAGEGVISFEEFDLPDDGAVTVSFCDGDWMGWEAIATTMQNLRDWLIDQHDLDTADRLISPWMIRDLQMSSLRSREVAAPATAYFAESQGDDSGKPARILEMSEEDLRAQLEAERRKNESLTAQIAAESWKARRAEVQSFCEGLQRQGILTPAMLQPRSVNFSEGDEQKSDSIGLVDFMAELNPRQLSFVQGLLQKLPKQVDFSERAGDSKSAPADGNSVDPSHLATEATKIYQEKRSRGINPTFAECVHEAKQKMGVIEV